MADVGGWSTVAFYFGVLLSVSETSYNGKDQVVKFSQHQQQDGVKLVLSPDSGFYQLIVNNQLWLDSAPTFFTVDRRRLYAGTNLTLAKVYREQGKDILGQWNSTVWVYTQKGFPTEIQFETVFKQYASIPDIVLFGQRFPHGANHTSLGRKNSISSGFPCFKLEAKRRKGRKSDNAQDGCVADSWCRTARLGYLAYGGIMFGNTGRSIGRWTVSGIKDIASGLDSGPLVLFSDDSDVLVISSFTEFMSVSAEYVKPPLRNASVSWGIMGGVDSVPAKFSLWTVASYSRHGINQAMKSWGEVLRRFYERGTEYRDSDLVNSYIGYYTDNGAYYYYNTEPGANYEKTLIAVKQYAAAANIPYRYIQYDSWWYHKGPHKGVTEWTPRPDVFPDGLKFMWNVTDWISVGHNRWWSSQTVYAKQNGGKYDFIVENKTLMALPIDARFWQDLFLDARKWGLTMYEQDWLNDQFDEMESTVSELGLGRLWLRQMGDAARQTGLTLMYCMSPSRHALQTLEIPVVSQARVSNDYQPGDVDDLNWKIGESSMFADALGVAPSKDTFWTTTQQPGNPYNKSEPFPELHSVVATLSTGPVAPGDRIGYSNTTIIARSCNAEGLLLKPSKPATTIDIALQKKAFAGFHGEVWSTYCNVSSWMFGIIFAAGFADGETLTVTPDQAGFGLQFPQPSVIYSWFDVDHKLTNFSRSSPLTLTDCTKRSFCLYISAPVFTVRSTQFVVYGELEKWVPVSPQRVASISLLSSDTAADVLIQLTGAANEHVTFSVGRGGTQLDINCIMSVDGRATLSIANARCEPV